MCALIATNCLIRLKHNFWLSLAKVPTLAGPYCPHGEYLLWAWGVVVSPPAYQQFGLGVGNADTHFTLTQILTLVLAMRPHSTLTNLLLIHYTDQNITSVRPNMKSYVHWGTGNTHWGRWVGRAWGCGNRLGDSSRIYPELCEVLDFCCQ